MPLRNALVAGLCAALLCLSSASQEAGAPQDGIDPEQTLAQMDWLAGSWSGEMWGGVFHAHYSTPEGGKILSHSRLMRGEKEAFFEFELFEVREGVPYLQPFPGGQKAVGFPLASHDPKARKAIFENPTKDYPTRITYQRVSDDELLITLDDPTGASDKVERFALSR